MTEDEMVDGITDSMDMSLSKLQFSLAWVLELVPLEHSCRS